MHFSDSLVQSLVIYMHGISNRSHICRFKQGAKGLTQVQGSFVTICCCEYLGPVRRVADAPRLAGVPVTNLILQRRTIFLTISDSRHEHVTPIASGSGYVERRIEKAVPEVMYFEAVDRMLERAMPSERQGSEWGVRAVKGPFKR